MRSLTLPAVLEKAAAVQARLGDALARYGRLVYSNSIDTGRLHEETYELLERLQRRYQRRLRLVYPDAQALEALVARQGVNGFYESLSARLECCRIRKVEPFRRAIAGYPAWITGVRREQSTGRALGQLEEWDAEHNLYKLSPLLEWNEADVWEYIRARR